MRSRDQADRAGSPSSFDYDAAIRACAAGDRGALRRLYEAEAARLLGVALRIVRRRDLADDVVHDAFVLIWNRAATFDPARGSGRAWIYTIVRNRSLNLVRDERFEHTADAADLERLAEGQGEAWTALERLGERSALKRCLELLEERRRDSILLAYVEGLSHTQIAARLSVPLGTVKAWIRRSLLALRECLQ